MKDPALQKPAKLPASTKRATEVNGPVHEQTWFRMRTILPLGVFTKRSRSPRLGMGSPDAETKATPFLLASVSCKG